MQLVYDKLCIYLYTLEQKIFHNYKKNRLNCAYKSTLNNSNVLYQNFSRNQWSEILSYIPITITEREIKQLKITNESISFEEVIKIYLPLSGLLNFYYSSNLRKQIILERFIHYRNHQRVPFIISIAGSVAVGKSTTARILQKLLKLWPEHRSVELITTDDFLFSNKILKERGLMKKKGFPISYDIRRLVQFILDVKSGIRNVIAPVYSHLIYDIIPNNYKIIKQPDILILEGVNVLQNGIDNLHHVFISDFVDFSIYLDAPEELLKTWYINRFLKLCKWALNNPNSYFYNYTKLSKSEIVNIATSIWNEINYVNLKNNILPTREYASLILMKSKNHIINQVYLRKQYLLYNILVR